MKRYYIVLLLLHAALAALAGHLPLPPVNILGGAVSITEELHYADAIGGSTPRYDGKISARERDSRLTTYTYDGHGRLAASVCRYEGTGSQLSTAWDYSTEYTYDRNANITSLKRMGIVDKVGLRNEYGLHSHYTMQYSRNQLTGMMIEKEGEDYEGRTGVGFAGNGTGFSYDANGNLSRDLSRDILETRYNRLNKPTDVYFLHGHRQTVTYDGFGQKRRVLYRQTSDPILATMMGVPEDSAYTLLGHRDYIGPHVFANDSLEYSAFPGGYFTPTGTFYYITDWQGNNIAVLRSDGSIEQQTTYYPYGEPTIEATGQRWLFGGKEREHAGGRNSYDYGARILTPLNSWSTPDPLATDFLPFSPFSLCGGDPINYVDPDGRRPIYSLEGAFLGTDDKGLTGEPWIMDAKLFKDSMSPELAEKNSVNIESLSKDIQQKIKDHFSLLPERPDYDGYLTLNEANKWYREGNGQTLYADFTKLDLSGFEYFNDVSEPTNEVFNLLNKRNNLNESLVYGNVSVIHFPNHTVRGLADIYDFDKKEGRGNTLRNILTRIGEQVAGKGTPYQIMFYGTVQLKPNVWRRILDLIK